jgi:16S rRNA (guanine(966)-N(2))-methyltransferase RsmD
LRVTGGTLRGRVISAPEGLAVRPSASKLRQAFFNILCKVVPDATFVDVCAGSGLMGIEALSRGAKRLISIEENRQQAQSIKDNLQALGLADMSEVIVGNARKVLPLLGESEADLIFADPPYKSTISQVVLELVGEHGLLAQDGILVIEHAKEPLLAETTESLTRFDQRKYGQTLLSFYRRAV